MSAFFNVGYEVYDQTRGKFGDVTKVGVEYVKVLFLDGDEAWVNQYDLLNADTAEFLNDEVGTESGCDY